MSQVTRYTNRDDLPLSLAVFLITDNYDHEQAGISATGLLKPTRQTVLSKRVPEQDQITDISGNIASALGTAVHDAIEKAWLDGNIAEKMMELGYPERVANKVRVNPDRDEALADRKMIPVFMEQRLYREIDGVTISGKFDMLINGQLEDFKNTSTFTYMNETKAWDYSMQGSIYRWLDPELITEPTVAISYNFTDWQAFQARANPKYPKSRMLQKHYPLLPLQDTEDFIRGKLAELKKYMDAPEEEIPYCSDKELWRSEPKFKYYRNPDLAAKGGRSTKNFDNLAEAQERHQKDGSIGTIVTVPGQVKACLYCPAFDLCSQKDALIRDGSLILPS